MEWDKASGPDGRCDHPWSGHRQVQANFVSILLQKAYREPYTLSIGTNPYLFL